MHYLTEVGSTDNKIPCYNCGDLIVRNQQSICVTCLCSTVDLKTGIGSQYDLHMCGHCERFCVPPGKYVQASLESAELLRICLSKIGQFKSSRLVDASFIWTEPHSKRVKVKLVVEKEISGVCLQQTFSVDFVICSRMCGDCHKVEADNFWSAVVQVRQRSSCRKALLHLEQAIIKYNLRVIGIRKQRDGFDLYNSNRNDSDKLASFISSFLPSKVSHSKQLKSQDVQNSKAFFHFTTLIEIVPINKHSLLCLPPSLGIPARFCLCMSVTRGIRIVDPTESQTYVINSTEYWRYPFHPLLNPDALQIYHVVDIYYDEPSYSRSNGLAHCWVLPEGSTDYENGQVYAKTHLGNILKPGDMALGYNLANCNVNNPEFEALQNSKHKDTIPVVILVKKFYAKFKKRRKRNWKLRRLANETEVLEEESQQSVEQLENRDYDNFLEDLEEDPLLRIDVNIYKDFENLNINETEDDDSPVIQISEMFSHMDI